MTVLPPQGQVAIAQKGHVFADDRFTRRTDRQRFGQFLAAAVRHDGELGRLRGRRRRADREDEQDSDDAPENHATPGSSQAGAPSTG